MATLRPMGEILEKVQSDVKEAMREKDRDRLTTLRMIADQLQQDEKMGDGDEVAVLQRERKRRLDAAKAYRDGDRIPQADAEDSEARLIESYLPEQLSDDELGSLVDEAISETGATEQKDMGGVMKALMPKVAGRADGSRVSEAVRERLGS
ncbi:MAG: GatB/YqeY domain-containing protein [bacterium]